MSDKGKVFLSLLLVFVVSVCTIASYYTNRNRLEENKKKIYFFLTEKGLSSVQAAAVVGNFTQESGCDPKAENSKSGAYGIAQWLRSRKESLFAFAERDGRSVDDIMLQLDFMWHELNTIEKRSLEALKQENVLTKNKDGEGGAVESFCRLYERCRSYEEALHKRLEYAREVLEKYKNK